MQSSLKFIVVGPTLKSSFLTDTFCTQFLHNVIGTHADDLKLSINSQDTCTYQEKLKEFQTLNNT